MNRRVLLVDSDTGFRDTLTKQLGRYRVVVMTEPDAERALTLGQADPPDLVIIAVEEPEKAGFKSFQKFRKALSAKVPIVLVTASVPPDSFAKHRGLKVHANEYIDKRGMTSDELVGKIDNLIGLGDLQEDEDLGLPVEEDIPMEIADGDVVLDEQLEDDDRVSSFEHDMQTVGPGSGIQMDQMLDAETDAAFASLLGGDEPAPAHEPAPLAEPELESPVEQVVDHDSIPEPIGGSGAYAPVTEEPEPMELAPPPPSDALDEDSAIPEPVPHKIPDDAPEPDDRAPTKALLDMDSVPSPIHDSGSAQAEHEAAAPADDMDEAPTPTYDVVDEAAAPVDEVAASASDVIDEVAAPASDIVDEVAAPASDVVEEVAASASDVVEEVAADDRNISLSGIPIVDDDLVSLDDDVPVEIEEDVPPVEVEAPHEAATPDARVLAEPVISEAARRPASATTPPPRPNSPTGTPPPRPNSPTSQPLPSAPRAHSPTGAHASPSGAHPAVDLGLDDIAQRAESEQSGLYDRKSLRTIGELERQISQLKTELERARAAAEAAAKGGSRENQFLNLREQNLAKDKELKQIKAAVEHQAKELAEAQEKLRQSQHAKATLESKNSELEERLLEDSNKQKELAASLKAATAQASQLEQDLEAKTRAATSAETALAQAEKDLATERASRAATASESERTLRTEREQLIQRHKGELAALKAEAETAQEFALNRLREDLDAAHAAKLEEALEELRRASRMAHDEALEALEKKHNGELVNLKADHAGEVSRIKNELGGELSKAKGELGGEIERLKAALDEAHAGHVAAIAAARDEHASQLDQLAAQHAQAKADLESQHAEAHGEAQAQATAAQRQLEATLAETKS
ncbi:MAG: response regulator, partial [Kofleriaceae bacterium]|nr:response regulator [Kofleriaceae bacterium]